jgi:hypothetical protein
VPRYEVTFAVPGNMAWCTETKFAFDEWMAGMAESEYADGLLSMPALSVHAHSGYGELVMTWVEVEADNAWAATKEVEELGKLAFPDLLETLSFMRLEVNEQDPNPERRRPTGA